jgi:hypothetical protein
MPRLCWRCMMRLAALLALSSLPSLIETAQASALVPELRGLISMGNIGFHNRDDGVPDNSIRDLEERPGIFGGVVINLTWAELEPRRGTIDTGPLSRALDAVRAYNRNTPDHPLGVKLRVWPGPNAPQWVKEIGGSPVPIFHTLRDGPAFPITIPRFWSSPVRSAWRQFLTALGRGYEMDPLIREVADTSCSSVTDEPVLLQGDLKSIAAMRDAGFTDADYRGCLLDSPADYNAWGAQRIELAVNPYREIDRGRAQMVPEFASEMARHWRQSLGQRGILSSHALQWPPVELLEAIYRVIQQAGPPIEFQTHSPRGLDWDQAIHYGRELGAGAIEVWPAAALGGFEAWPNERLRGWANMLAK